MNNPDIRRWVILLAIGLCAYWLVQSWVAYQKQKNPDDYAGNPAPHTVPNEGTEDSNIPTDVLNANGSADTSDDGDVPDASLVAPQREVENRTTDVINRDLIEVKTPLHHIWIDPIGGDIVGAKLPEYPVSLKNLEIPTTLLDRRFGRTYIAQSGLYEQNGSSTQPPKPVFNSSARIYEFEDDAVAGNVRGCFRL